MRKYGFLILFLGIAIGLSVRSLFFENEAAAKIVTIKSRNLEYEIETRAHTVGELLGPEELTSESRENDELRSGYVIQIFKPVSISVRDGENAKKSLRTSAETVDDLIREQQIPLAATDRVTPGFGSYLSEGMEIQIDRIVDLEVVEKHDIDYQIITEDDPSSFYGREEIVSKGEKGKKEMKFMITYKNGVETKRRLLSESVIEKPVNEQRRVGTRIEVELTEEGRASWYAYKACLCAAHPSYMKGRFVRVTATSSGKSVIVRINDWGPDRSIFPERVIDLDAVAYKLLAPLGSGTIGVKTELLK